MSQSTDVDQRIARARTLAIEIPAAREALTFYASLADYQRTLAADAGRAIDPDAVVAAVPAFLSWLRRAAPAHLAESAAALSDIDPEEWRTLVDEGLSGDVDDSRDPTRRFVVEAVLQPHAEMAARSATSRSEERSAARCPRCGGLPVVGVLRGEGHGARRTLVCGLCLTEREFLRVVCPGCAEEQFERLPVYTSDAFPHVRIDACEACRRYLKVVDLTKDGHAVPIVDDIATVALDLWARERGYARLRLNILAL